MPRVLVIGSGGREHAIAWKLRQSGRVDKVFIAPGNGSEFGSVTGLDIDDEHAILEFCTSNQVELVVIGPEGPLAKGLSDRLSPHIKVFGPTRQGAMLESSKSFSKRFMEQFSLPTAEYRTFDDAEKAEQFIKTCSWMGIVVKADWLAAGKGVVVATSEEDAIRAARNMLQGEFGQASREVVLEEMLEGYEVSALCFTDGRSLSRMPLIRDHKRLLDGDQGPNTGGMGVVGPVTVPPEVDTAIDNILHDTVEGLKTRGAEYQGVIYAGFMVTEDGPKLLEFNCRFGDPETEILMRLLNSDLFDIFVHCCDGTLDRMHVDWKQMHACGIVLAGRDYPYSSDSGKQINVLTAGGRILCCTALASTPEDARSKAVAACEQIQFEGKRFRKDIGTYRGPVSLSYGDAGVDIAAGNAFVDDIKQLVKSTLLPGTGQIGGFGAVVDLHEAGYSNGAQLVIGIDGVGTKIEVADALNEYEWIGHDVVGMCVNDVVCHGAQPLAFLDYFVCGRLDTHRAVSVVRSITDACKASGCSLVGGETAEMPGVYLPQQWDLAGCAIAARQPHWPVLPNTDSMRVGDQLIALRSSGVHSNGFSLVRRIVSLNKLKYTNPAPWDQSITLGKALLAPTRLYVKSTIDLMTEGYIKGAAHITGGGITENAIRALDSKGKLAMQVDCSFPKPPVFDWLSGAGPVDHKEMLKTFNCGVGMVLIVASNHVDEVVRRLSASGEQPMRIGELVERRDDRLITYKNMPAAFSGDKYRRKQRKVRVAVLISGAGSNMARLLERAARGDSNCQIAVVISNKPSAGGLAIASRAGVPTAVIPHTQDRVTGERAMTEALRAAGVELICLAGYMRVLTAEFVNAWAGRLVNIHPSLLPSFKGAHAVRDALAAGVRVAGCTVHFVVPEVDAGEIVAQSAVAVNADDTEDTLHDRIQTEEHRLFPEAMEIVADRILNA